MGDLNCSPKSENDSAYPKLGLWIFLILFYCITTAGAVMCITSPPDTRTPHPCLTIVRCPLNLHSVTLLYKLSWVTQAQVRSPLSRLYILGPLMSSKATEYIIIMTPPLSFDQICRGVALLRCFPQIYPLFGHQKLKTLWKICE